MLLMALRLFQIGKGRYLPIQKQVALQLQCRFREGNQKIIDAFGQAFFSVQYQATHIGDAPEL